MESSEVWMPSYHTCEKSPHWCEATKERNYEREVGGIMEAINPAIPTFFNVLQSI